MVNTLIESTIVIDGHSDVLIPLTNNLIDISQRVNIPSSSEWDPPLILQNNPHVKFGFDPHTIHFGCAGQYDIPRWKEGGVNTQLCAIYLDDDQLEASYENGMKMVEVFHENISKNEELIHCTTVEDIKSAKADGKIGWVLSFEGCEALGNDLNKLDDYYRHGLRAASLTHTRNNIFAQGCWGEPIENGLTPLGRELIGELEARNIVIDLVHIGQDAFWEILDIVSSPVILSHSTSTMFPSTRTGDNDFMDGRVPRPRLEDPRDRKMLEAIAKNGGVLGMIWILYRDLESAVADIETAWEIMGPDHVGLGSDLYGEQLATPGLEDISKLPNLLRELVKRGHSDEKITKFLGGNYLRVFEEVWGS